MAKLLLWWFLFLVSVAALWPPPKFFQASGDTMLVAPDLQLVNEGLQSQRLKRGFDRFMSSWLARHPASYSQDHGNSLSKIRVQVTGHSEQDETHVGSRTCYNYTLRIQPNNDTGVITSCSIYGAMYALESFSQLVAHSEGGQLPHSNIEIRDSPDYTWRGLMLDSGRRFVPMPVVQDILRVMAANKLNVLHLHASDMCRFGVESKAFPNLTASLQGIHAGHYTQDDIKSLIEFAGDRGIRVVPEFDLPGHSRGYLPLEDEVAFCEPDSPGRSQLYNDPQNVTYHTLKTVLEEMAGLFTDEVFNVGCDETAVKGPCSLQSTFSLERQILTDIEKEFGKTPEGWEEVYFDAQAATPNTIVNAWSRHSASEITALGLKAVESKSSAFYFTAAAPGGPTGWKKCWYDIASNVAASQRHLLLGGEMSMWTDTYCYTGQCGASSGTPVGAALFPPETDREFGLSIGGMIWPRGFVGAGAFWNYDATVDPSSDGFVSAIWKLNDELIARNLTVCPTNCSCDQLSACGVPYLKPSPTPAPSFKDATLTMEPCIVPTVAGQLWNKDAQTSQIRLRNTSLCISTQNNCTDNCYPLVLQQCNSAVSASLSFDHAPHTSELVVTSARFINQCVDLRADGLVGLYNCGSHAGLNQPNQHWAFDQDTSFIVAQSAGTMPGAQPKYAGMCLTAST